MAQSVTLINVFEVPVGEDEEFTAGWERAAEFLREQEGFISSALHQILAPDATFRFINVARWESPAAFQKAVTAPGFPGGQMRHKAHPALYRVIREEVPAGISPKGG